MNYFGIDDKVTEMGTRILKEIKPVFEKIEGIAEKNQQKMLYLFKKHRVSEMHLGTSTGYGYNDVGRETLEKIMADCMGAQDALIRHSFASGTHTLTVALFGVLRPSDTVLSVIGRPYDTITGVFGIDEKNDGSLADFGIKYDQVNLIDGEPDYNGIEQKLKEKFIKMAYIQRSRGYNKRKTLTINVIKKLCSVIKTVSPNTIIMVDNCYGEFVEPYEPCHVGADLCAGSLIKNPGGGIAPSGGYIAGRHDLIEKCAARMTCPGVGREVGATLGTNREMYMGLYSSPHIVCQALKTAIYSAALFSKLGFNVSPEYDEPRGDIIEYIELNTPQNMVNFCRGLQSGSPIDSFVNPEPWDMPGYNDKVIMAAGAFTGGSSIELSADGPMREPYGVWLQGGLNFESARVGIELAASNILKNKG